MRALVLGLAVWLAPFAAQAQLVRVQVQQPTDVAFAADSESGMLVVAENGGAGYAPGYYKFVRIDREARRVLEPVDLLVGAVRGQVLFGPPRPGAPLVTHGFHYAIVAPGDYALVYWNSSVINPGSSNYRSACLSESAPIYSVGAGAIAVVHAPDRAASLWDLGGVRRPLLRLFPEGTTLDYIRSAEKAALDFAETAATNTRLTAPYAMASPIGTLAFDVPARADHDACQPGDGFTVTLAH
jgi:hypothetical protein